MSLFATGITVITSRRADDVHGMTANSFTAVSLEPPLVLFCVGKSARMAGFVEDAPGFAINILSGAQEHISRQFAGPQRAITATVELCDGPVAPLVSGALASISCLTEAVHEGGDHWIVVGRVVELREENVTQSPLVFFRSRYCQLLEPREARPERDPWTHETQPLRLYHAEWSEGADDLDPEHEP
jgi:3-hydroxy-9,10-secoandrosta-1,3,5(10)-triene-9,17-dione monooxygenase reductase component